MAASPVTGREQNARPSTGKRSNRVVLASGARRGQGCAGAAGAATAAEAQRSQEQPGAACGSPKDTPVKKTGEQDNQEQRQEQEKQAGTDQGQAEQQRVQQDGEGVDNEAGRDWQQAQEEEQQQRGGLAGVGPAAFGRAGEPGQR